MKKSRIWELDFLRGFAIVMVVIDHAMYDLSYLCTSWKRCGISALETLYRVGNEYMTGDVRFFWRPSFLFLFFCISGVCTAFSKNNLIRGLRLFVVSAAVSLVTYAAGLILDEDCFILMGVLHCLSLVTIAYALFDLAYSLAWRPFRKKAVSPRVKVLVKSALLLALSVVFIFINEKYNVRLADVFRSGDVIKYDHDWRGLFFYEASWWTADYFPLFPYIAFFFFGASLSELLYPQRKSLFPSLDGKWHYLFSVPGRYSLWIYLAGQVVAIGLCMSLTAIFIK